ncbi:MAG: carbohydrate ABC transporter substrate-binding protein [Clostridiaceae bacterium]|nr:carbohydrate ABC transporter substrate-binding protein [Clostridiaceae bacterium]
MKKAMRQLVAVLLCLSIAGCSSSENVREQALTSSPTPVTQESQDKAGEQEKDDTGVVPDDGDSNNSSEGEKVITIYCENGEIQKLIEKFLELHPDFEYEIKIYNEYMFRGDDPDRVHKLIKGKLDVDPPDIYSVVYGDIYKCTRGSDHEYALPFEDLGLDIGKLVEEAEIPQYMIDVGANPDGKLVALGYSNGAGAFIYRRSIARKVWGTDDPASISGKIGPGWDRFMDAAADLKARGYSICSSIDDIWNAYDMSLGQGWFQDGQLVIDPAREAFLDIARKMVDNGYVNNTIACEWYDDMKGEGDKEVFGFLGPYWMLSYVIAGCRGGDTPGEGTYGDWAVCDPPAGFFWRSPMFLAHRDTRHREAVGEIIRWLTLDTSETGAQYLWATGQFTGIVEIPSSMAVAKKVEYKYDFLGGQDLFEAYLHVTQNVRGNSLSERGSTFSSI